MKYGRKIFIFLLCSCFVLIPSYSSAELNVDITKPAGQTVQCGPDKKGTCGDYINGGSTCGAGDTVLRKGDSGNDCEQNPKVEAVCCVPKSTNKTEASGGGVNPADYIPQGTGLSTATPQEVLMKVLNWLLLIFGSLAILAFLFSGAQYLLAFGDDDQVKTAKKNVKLSMMGIAIAFSAMILITAIAGLLGAE